MKQGNGARRSTYVVHGAGAASGQSAEVKTKAELQRKAGRIIVAASGPNKLTMASGSSRRQEQRLTKLLLNVYIQNSLGPLQVLMSPENTVADLTKAAIDIYVKEKRRPLLATTDSRCFELHYSQFSLESLQAEANIISLGSRNFFLCPKSGVVPINSSRADKAKTTTSAEFPSAFTKFTDFLL